MELIGPQLLVTVTVKVTGTNWTTNYKHVADIEKLSPRAILVPDLIIWDPWLSVKSHDQMPDSSQISISTYEQIWKNVLFTPERKFFSLSLAVFSSQYVL